MPATLASRRESVSVVARRKDTIDDVSSRNARLRRNFTRLYCVVGNHVGKLANNEARCTSAIAGWAEV